MATDRRLSADFWLHEAPCYLKATESDVAALQETVTRVLQPARAEFGPIEISSWKWWRDGCSLRSGPHQFGGTVDVVPTAAPARDVWEWMAKYIIPAGYVGRLIYEPARTKEEGVPQGEHIHIAPRRDMVADIGDSTIEVLEETAEGVYELRYQSDWPPMEPIEIPGLVVTAPAPGLFGLLFTLGALALFAGSRKTLRPA